MAGADLSGITVAVGSGKGGVGKSTVTVNLAVHWAARGFRVALVDLDPLSNLHVILDIPENRMQGFPSPTSEDSGLEDHVLPLFPRIDLLFPGQRMHRVDAPDLREALFTRFPSMIAARWDVVILDLPAGISHEENLSFLPFIRNLVIVCNSEPTSHVSAGGYIRASSEINPELSYHIWHNKFDRRIIPGFDPRALVENYNHYVPEDLSITPDIIPRVQDVAFLPHDPSMDLLYAEGEYHHHLLGKFLELADLLDSTSLAEMHSSCGLPRSWRILIKHYVIHHGEASGYEGLMEWLGDLGDGTPPAFTLEQSLLIRKYLAVQARHPLRERTSRMRRAFLELQELLVDGSLTGREARLRQGSVHTSSTRAMGLCRSLLEYLCSCLEGERKAPWPAAAGPDMRRLAGLLLYYYAFYRLSENGAMQKSIRSFVPHRQDSTGRPVRDRRAQISLLVEHDKAYRDAYFGLVKRIFPVVQKQMLSIATGSRLKTLVFLDPSGKPNHNAYLKLLNRTVNDIANSGLGIGVGLQFNTSANEFRKGADLLRERIGMTIREA